MPNRLLEATPSQMINMSPRELLDAIRASEGRTINAYICPKAAPYIERVSNLELAASFGADMIFIEGFDPFHGLRMPGLPSKNPEDDKEYRWNLQCDMGYGYTIRELKKLVGRPVGTFLMVPFEGFDPFMSGIFADHYYTPENLENLIQQGYDYVAILSVDFESELRGVREAVEIAKGRIIIESGLPHGPGVVYESLPPYNLREFITPEMCYQLAMAGADIVDMPAVGMVPGFTADYVTEIAAAIHEGKSLALCNIAHSLEGADSYTIKRIALTNRECGADIFTLAAGGVYESIALPETLLDLSIALKGRRHTYRRMAQSPLR